MKIFPVSVIPSIDNHTIKHEPITSVNLMERVARAFFEAIVEHYKGKQFFVLAGPGNNGGDALAVARMLISHDYEVTTILLRSDNLSEDCAFNLERLKNSCNVQVNVWEDDCLRPRVPDGCIVIDGLFGTGLKRPLEGKALRLVREVNAIGAEVVAIDIPSGLMGEDNSANNREGIIRAKLTFSFQFPKLAFLFPENHDFVGRWRVLDIKLNLEKIARTPTQWFLTEPETVRQIIPHRETFSHKGKMGHVLLIAGSHGKMGAALLAAKASLRAGAGLLTVQVPRDTCNMFHVGVPEAMVNIDCSNRVFTEFPELTRFNAVGVGPATGEEVGTVKALSNLLDNIGSIPLILDADAITIISRHPGILSKVPPGTILTPHPGEFERLVGKWGNDYQRLQKAIDLSSSLKVILVVKGAYTTIVLPDGTCHFNPTGNPGMATAGSGDVLTGIILALLGKGIAPAKAALAGVYLHGLAGDIASQREGQESLIASDIISSLGPAFTRLLQ